MYQFHSHAPCVCFTLNCNVILKTRLSSATMLWHHNATAWLIHQYEKESVVPEILVIV